MILLEINEPIEYGKIIEHDDNFVILEELAKNGNAEAICRLAVMWYDGKFEEVGEFKRSKKMQMMVAQYLFNYIPESGEANYYLYKLCNGNIFQHLEYLQKSANSNFELAKKELANCHRHGRWGFEINEEKVYEIISPYIDDKIEEKFEETMMKIFKQFEKYILNKSYIDSFSLVSTEKIIMENIQHKWYFRKLILNPNLSEDFLKQHFRLEYEEIIEEERKKEIEDALEKENKIREDIDYERILDHYNISIPNIKFDNDFFYNISSSPNITFDLYEKYINKKWNLYWISRNEKIPPEFLIKKYDLKEIQGIYLHPKLTPFLVEKYKNKRWNPAQLAPNKNFPIMFFEEHINKHGVTQGLSQRKDLFPHFVLKHRNVVWPWNSLASNENFPIYFFEEYFNKKNTYIFKGFSSRKDIDIDFVKFHKNKEWDRRVLAKNENLPLDFLCGDRNSLYGLIENPNLTLDFIDEKITLVWPWENLQKKFNITQDFVEENKDMICVWKMLSYCDDVDIEFIKKYIKKPWEWLPLSKNLTLDFILEYPNKNYNLNAIFIPEKVIELKEKIKQDMIDNYLR